MPHERHDEHTDPAHHHVQRAAHDALVPPPHGLDDHAHQRSCPDGAEEECAPHIGHGQHDDGCRRPGDGGVDHGVVGALPYGTCTEGVHKAVVDGRCREHGAQTNGVHDDGNPGRGGVCQCDEREQQRNRHHERVLMQTPAPEWPRRGAERHVEFGGGGERGGHELPHEGATERHNHDRSSIAAPCPYWMAVRSFGT